MITLILAAIAAPAPANGTGEFYGFMSLLVTNVAAVATLYLQGRKQHADNDGRLTALEEGLSEIREALGIKGRVT